MENSSKHHRTGYRKPGAKRATICLRLTDETKANLQAQAAAVGISAGDYVARLVENQFNRYYAFEELLRREALVLDAEKEALRDAFDAGAEWQASKSGAGSDRP
jgi:hypothetical protein